MSRLAALGVEAASRLAQLHAEAFDRPWSAVEFQTLLAQPGVGALAVEEDEALLGFVLIRAIAGEAEILTLAVAPNARRRRIGAALVEAATAAAQSLGAEALFLEVAADNVAALALYRRASFDVAGRRPGYYARAAGAAMDAVVMRRPLNTASA